jgi:hypothetical protein
MTANDGYQSPMTAYAGPTTAKRGLRLPAQTHTSQHRPATAHVGQHSCTFVKFHPQTAPVGPGHAVQYLLWFTKPYHRRAIAIIPSAYVHHHPPLSPTPWLTLCIVQPLLLFHRYIHNSPPSPWNPYIRTSTRLSPNCHRSNLKMFTQVLGQTNSIRWIMTTNMEN